MTKLTQRTKLHYQEKCQARRPKEGPQGWSKFWTLKGQIQQDGPTHRKGRAKLIQKAQLMADQSTVMTGQTRVRNSGSTSMLELKPFSKNPCSGSLVLGCARRVLVLGLARAQPCSRKNLTLSQTDQK